MSINSNGERMQRSAHRSFDNVLHLLIPLSIAVCLLCACKPQSHNKGQKTGKTQIEFKNSKVDMGVLTSDSAKAIGELKFSNVGDEPLVIHKVEAGCSCTSVDYSQKPIKPGGSGVIHIELDVSGIRGNFSKEIVVYCNAGDFPYQLTICGSVEIDQ